MAAQGSERKFNICDRCFASVPVSQPFCPECGAPIVTEEAHAEGSDSAVYTELARANLLRMRGDYRQAEEQCLNILKRFPNNASANTLLGDISAEQNDLTQAVQWYELSLDLIPDDDAVKVKLKSVRDRIALHETANTAKELGLPATAAKKNRFIAGVVALIALVALAAYVFGTKEGAVQAKQTNVTPAVKVPPQNTTGSDTGGDTGGDEPISAGGGELPLLRRLTASTADGTRVLAVFQDPRTKAVTVSYTVTVADPRPLGARLARSVFDVEADALNVTVRAMREGNLVYTADVLRSRLNETTTQAWKAQNTDPNDWIAYILSNEWLATPPKKEEPTKPDEDQKKSEDTDSSSTTKASTKAPDETPAQEKSVAPQVGSG